VLIYRRADLNRNDVRPELVRGTQAALPHRQVITGDMLLPRPQGSLRRFSPRLIGDRQPFLLNPRLFADKLDAFAGAKIPGVLHVLWIVPVLVNPQACQPRGRRRMVGIVERARGRIVRQRCFVQVVIRT